MHNVLIPYRSIFYDKKRLAGRSLADCQICSAIDFDDDDSVILILLLLL